MSPLQSRTLIDSEGDVIILQSSYNHYATDLIVTSPRRRTKSTSCFEYTQSALCQPQALPRNFSGLHRVPTPRTHFAPVKVPGDCPSWPVPAMETIPGPVKWPLSSCSGNSPMMAACPWFDFSKAPLLQLIPLSLSPCFLMASCHLLTKILCLSAC